MVDQNQELAGHAVWVRRGGYYDPLFMFKTEIIQINENKAN